MESMIEEQVSFETWDPADDIEEKEDVITLLEVSFEENDPDFLLRAVGYILRSEGLCEFARELGMSREDLAVTLAPTGQPTLGTVFKLIDTLGLQIKLEKKPS